MAVECDTQEPLCLGSDLFPASHAETHETNTLDAPHDTCGHAEGRILLEVCISLQLSVFFFRTMGDRLHLEDKTFSSSSFHSLLNFTDTSGLENRAPEI